MSELNLKDFEVIFDVLNVYDPNDISHVYPAMGEQEFLDGVKIAWGKVLEKLSELESFTPLHSDTAGGIKWEKNDFDVDMNTAIWDN